jgi:hypothetical protein
MGKTNVRDFGKQLLSDAAKVLEKADSALHTVLECLHLSRWHPVSTAPYNQDLEIRINEDGVTSDLPFPCRHTNGDKWINVDLGIPLQVRPVEWRIWRKGKSPHPHQSSIFDPQESIARRRAQWSGYREDRRLLKDL